MTSKKSPTHKDFYVCDVCQYETLSFRDYKKHILTKKHEILTNTYKKGTNIPSHNQWGNICGCGKVYKHRQSLYNHKKKCKYEEIKGDGKDIEEKEEDIDYKEMLMILLKENKEIRKQMGELIPKVGNNNSMNSNNSVKQKFNINVFLNEDCKDALTMNEFIDKIKITLDDLMITKEKGIVEGVTNIFIENMNKLSLYERPIHCTDVKRETVYIKCGENKQDNMCETNKIVESGWRKDKENKRIKEALGKVGHEQRKALSKWVERHPQWNEKVKEQEEYMLLISKCTGDLGGNKSNEKAIKKICNEVYVGGE